MLERLTARVAGKRSFVGMSKFRVFVQSSFPLKMFTADFAFERTLIVVNDHVIPQLNVKRERHFTAIALELLRQVTSVVPVESGLHAEGLVAFDALERRIASVNHDENLLSGMKQQLVLRKRFL